jgi:hypothetical protein
MKKMYRIIALTGVTALLFTACQKDVKDAPKEEITSDVLAQIKGLGFGTKNVQKVDEGYLVEGDIILTPEHLRLQPNSPRMIIANEEQYHTFYLVKGLPRVITVSAPSSPAGFSNAVNAAIARYNNERLTLTFQRVASGGDINIRVVNTGQYIASAGFPTSSGDPYNDIKYANRYTTYSDGFMTTVLAHEIGHCIGFRHTDYMNRAYSCGSGGNEGQETSGVGAVFIPGTASGPDAGSWMLACLGASTNRPFNSNDKTALGYVY